MREPLPAEGVRKAIEHRGPSRVPMMIHQWTYAGAFEDRADQVQAILDEYPNDIYSTGPRMPDFWDEPDSEIPGYAWLNTPQPEGHDEVHAHDANIAIPDIGMLDEILDAWPDPNIPQMYEGCADDLAANANGRYTTAGWAFCFYERMWSLRGMENILCDFYEHPKAMHKLMDALCDFHETVIRRAGKELKLDAINTTDDIGMQTGPMFSPAIFKEFFKPRYKRLIDAAHDHNMHFCLHTCGDVTLFMEDFIEIGLDVIHPIQKYTMDEREVAAKYGGRIAVWAGMDVQQILPWGAPADVRKEVRFMIDTYDRSDGGCMITAGNGITPDNPIENLRAFFDETYNYGLAHRQLFA
ncbi:MAG: uroporphyrinogen decarboxylase family protein [Planctomycetota bacterium]